MDIYAIFMGAAFAGMAAFFGLLIVLFRAWARTKERPAQGASLVARPVPVAVLQHRETGMSAGYRERDLTEILSAVATLTREMEETANAMFRRFEQKERRLMQLIKEADAVMVRLEEQPAQSQSAVARQSVRKYSAVEEMPKPAARPAAAQPAVAELRVSSQGKYAKAAELMALGKSASDVSRELSLHVGELELINNLRKIGM
jgi:hypothetical protein